MMSSRASTSPDGGCSVPIRADQEPVALNLYLQLAAGRGSAVSTQPLRDRFGEHLDHLSAIGAVRRGQPSSVVTCGHCFEGHSAEVKYDAVRRRSFFFCAEAGRVEIDDQERETVLPNLLWLPDQLARALAIGPSPPRRELIGSSAWLLGDAVIGSATVSLALAIGIRTAVELDLLIKGLRSRMIVDAGLVLVSGCVVVDAFRNTSNYQPVILSEIARLVGGAIEVNRAALAAWTRTMLLGDERPKAARGRPGLLQQVHNIRDARSNRGKTASTELREAQEIWQEWLDHFPDQGRPGKSTIRKHLKSLRSGRIG